MSQAREKLASLPDVDQKLMDKERQTDRKASMLVWLAAVRARNRIGQNVAVRLEWRRVWSQCLGQPLWQLGGRQPFGMDVANEMNRHKCASSQERLSRELPRENSNNKLKLAAGQSHCGFIIMKPQ